MLFCSASRLQSSYSGTVLISVPLRYPRFAWIAPHCVSTWTKSRRSLIRSAEESLTPKVVVSVRRSSMSVSRCAVGQSTVIWVAGLPFLHEDGDEKDIKRAVFKELGGNIAGNLRRHIIYIGFNNINTVSFGVMMCSSLLRYPDVFSPRQRRRRFGRCSRSRVPSTISDAVEPHLWHDSEFLR